MNHALLGDLGTFSNGVNFTRNKMGVGIPIINVKDITSSRWIDINNLDLVDIDVDDDSRAYRDDIFFVRSSVKLSGIGLVSKLKTNEQLATHCGFVIRFRPSTNDIDPDFLLYLLLSPEYRKKLINLSSGVSIVNISQMNLKSLRIPVPSIDVQQYIVDILSTYDDLIENNRRRITLLEQSVRLLYKEWFVHLRFPGHEHVKLVDGVPEGWDSIQLSSLCHIGRGASPRPISKFMDGDISWFKIGDATASESPFILETNEFVTDDGARKNIRLSPESLVLSNSATCGIPFFTGIDGCIHDGWLYFDQFDRINKFFLYCFLFFKQRELNQSVGDGSTQKNLNTVVVGRLRVVLPQQNNLLDLFTDIAEPLFSMIFALAKENIILRKGRDLLLPRLMNGEIAV